MAKIYSNVVRYYFGGFDLGTATTALGVTKSITALDVTTIGSAAERMLAGIEQGAIEWSGIFDDSLSSDAAGSAMIGSGTNNVWTLHLGTATGAAAYAGTAILTNSKAAASKTELVMAGLEWKVDGKVYKGVNLLVRTSFTGSGSSDPVDGSAASTGTSGLFLQVFSSSGAGSGTVFLQSASTATGVYTSFATVAAIAGRNSFIALATGTLDRFTRIIKAATGTMDLAAVVVRNIT